MGGPRLADPGQVAAMTRAGMTASRIAAALGCSARTVVRHRSLLGVTQARPPRLTAAQLRQARQLLADGASRAETARTLGCSTKTIDHWFPGSGWNPAEIGAFNAALAAHRTLAAEIRRGASR